MKLSAIIKYIPTKIIFSSLNCKEEVMADVMRIKRENSFKSLITFLSNSAYRRVFIERVRLESSFKAKLIHFMYRPLEAMSFNSVTGKIGGGVMVVHGYSTIIYANEIGKNFTAFQNVTVGVGKKNEKGIDTPTIKDNVTIYTGAVVFGPITIGNNVTIGAGAVVNKDVPDNCTVVGNPMRIIEKK